MARYRLFLITFRYHAIGRCTKKQTISKGVQGWTVSEITRLNSCISNKRRAFIKVNTVIEAAIKESAYV